MKTTSANLEPATSGTQLLHKRPRFAMPRLVPCMAAAVILLGGPSALAGVNTLSYWRMGENDPNPSGAAYSTNDPTGGRTMTLQGAPFWYSDVSPTAAARVGSSRSIRFFTSTYGTSTLVSSLTDNFGIELWVKPGSTSAGNQCLAYNGNSSSNGWGLYLMGNQYRGVFGGVTLVGTATATVGTWTHLALVRNNGTATLYVNGVASGTTANPPNPPTGIFGAAAQPQNPSLERLNEGYLDEVRVFSFAAGGYSANDLSYNYGPIFPVPIANLPQVGDSSVAWGDYDNDGRLDFLLTGSGISQLWRNTASGFTNVTANAFPPGGLPGLRATSVAWGDYDNDGRLDFLLTGTTADYSTGVSQLWRNTGSGFTNVTGSAFLPDGLPGVWSSSVAWGDYDNDGRLDFLLTGNSSSGEVSQLWRNTASGFTNVTESAFSPDGLPGVGISSVAWGDYDNDGRLDFLLTGNGPNDRVSQLWQNTPSGFTNVTPGLPGLQASSVAWGDYDNDGRLDFLLTGTANYNTGVSQLWRNTGSGFTNVTANVAPGLPQLWKSSVAWGDYDNDGRLDLLLTGDDSSGQVSQLWRNNTTAINTAPTAPTGLAMTTSTNAAVLSWNSATDGQTAASGLTYNVRAGTTPGGSDLFAGHVNATNGFRRVPALGNAMLRNSLPLTGLSGGQRVYWSVQAVDTSFVGGPFASEQDFTHHVFTAGPIANLPQVDNSSVAWGDYDNDGHLDFLLTGWNGSTGVSQLWQNTLSGFTNVTADAFPSNSLPEVWNSSVAWGDYNNDGRLDFLLTGAGVSQLWRNTGSGFENETGSAFPSGRPPGLQSSSVAWGDYDNDGRLDFLLTGQSSSGPVSQLWRNTGSGFTNVTPSAFPSNSLPGVVFSSVAWGDYDNDGRLDFLLTGYDLTILIGVSQLWRNTGSGFTNVTANVAPGLPGVSDGSVAWGDYDNDGRLDFLLTGSNRSQIWRNTGSGFTNVTDNVAPGLPGVQDSSVAWGDYDNDGRLDFLLAGNSPSDRVSQLWQNSASGFTNVTADAFPPNGLPGVSDGSVAWADYDNDGRLDFLLTGNGPSGRVSQLWRNNSSGSTNSPPAAPSGLSATGSTAGLTFSWAAASDVQTPADGLAYQLRIGTTPGGSELLSPMAAPSGTPRLPRASALQPARSRIINAPLPTNQPIYWSVQAADSGFAASPFSADQVLRLAGVPTPTNGVVLPGDTNGDGVLDQAEFAAVRAALGANELATQNTAGYYTQAQVQSLHVGTPLISQVSPGRFRLTLGVQKSTNLTNPFTDFSLTGPGTTTEFTPDGKLKFEFPSTDNAAFFRIETE